MITIMILIIAVIGEAFRLSYHIIIIISNCQNTLVKSVA